jgi:hypothetical protein
VKAGAGELNGPRRAATAAAVARPLHFLTDFALHHLSLLTTIIQQPSQPLLCCSCPPLQPQHKMLSFSGPRALQAHSAAASSRRALCVAAPHPHHRRAATGLVAVRAQQPEQQDGQVRGACVVC